MLPNPTLPCLGDEGWLGIRMTDFKKKKRDKKIQKAKQTAGELLKMRTLNDILPLIIWAFFL